MMSVVGLFIIVWTSAPIVFASATGFKIYELSSLGCPNSVQMSSEWLYSGQLLLDTDQSCTVTIQADHNDGNRLMVYFSLVNTDQTLTIDLYAHLPQLKIYDGSAVDQTRFLAGVDNHTYASQLSSQVFVTTQSSLTVDFTYNSADLSNVTHAVTFTAFREGFCDSSEYRCGNQRCIFHTLSCAGHNPCGDHSDCQVSIPAIAAIALCGFCTLGVSALLCYVIFQNTKDRLDLQRQPRKFSPSKAFGSFKSFTPATVTFTPLHRKWSTT